MIKKIIATGLLCLLATPIFAQNITIDFNKGNNSDKVSPKVREKMDEFQLQIHAIVKEEKEKLDQQIQLVNKEVETGILTETEAKQKKNDLAEESSLVINERIQAVNFNLDDLIKQQVTYTVLNGNEIDSLSTRSALEKKYRATHNIVGYLGYGFMGFTDKEDKDLNNHLGFLNNFEFGLSYTKQLNRESPWSLKSGLYMSWRTIRLEDNYQFVRNPSGVTTIVDSETTLDKSKLRGSYLMLPLGVKYTFGKKVTVEDFTYYKSSKFSITANVYGGVKLSSNNIYKGNGVKARDKKDYNLSPFVYGAQLTFNYGSWNLYARKEFSNYFKNNSFDDRKMFQVGIGIGF